MNSRFTDESLIWRQLCRAAVLEQDPDKLSQIVRGINVALKMQQQVLRNFAEAKRDHNPHIFETKPGSVSHKRLYHARVGGTMLQPGTQSNSKMSEGIVSL